MILSKTHDFIELVESRYLDVLKKQICSLGITETELKMLSNIISATPADFSGDLSQETIEYVTDVKISQVVNLYKDKDLNDAYYLAKRLLQYASLDYISKMCKKYSHVWDYIVDYSDLSAFNYSVEIYGVNKFEEKESAEFDLCEIEDDFDDGVLKDDCFRLDRIFASPQACAINLELKNTDAKALEVLAFVKNELL